MCLQWYIFAGSLIYFDISDLIHCYHLCNSHRINYLYPISHSLMYVYTAIFYIRMHFKMKTFNSL